VVSRRNSGNTPAPPIPKCTKRSSLLMLFRIAMSRISNTRAVRLIDHTPPLSLANHLLTDAVKRPEFTDRKRDEYSRSCVLEISHSPSEGRKFEAQGLLAKTGRFSVEIRIDSIVGTRGRYWYGRPQTMRKRQDGGK
jgi:hypothetical protein